jgi:hypothetical protein
VTVWAPSWMPIEAVSLIAGGSSVQRWDASAEPSVHQDPTRAVWFEHRISLRPGADEWYAIEVSGIRDLAPVYPGSRPWALTAPVFVDADGDGAFVRLR